MDGEPEPRPYTVCLRHFGSLRSPVRLWTFTTLDLAEVWCNSNIPPHPSLSTWQVIDLAEAVVSSGPWSWE